MNRIYEYRVTRPDGTILWTTKVREDQFINGPFSGPERIMPPYSYECREIVTGDWKTIIRTTKKCDACGREYEYGEEPS